MKKILIITVHLMNPLHPRISKEIEVLRNYNYVVEFLSVNDLVIQSVNSNRFFRGLFQNPFFAKKVMKQLEKFNIFDYFIFYDLHLLNIANQFKSLNPLKKVIYETIDDNLSLYLHYNFKKVPYYNSMEKKILPYLRRYELSKAFSLDAIIVNSVGLQKIFKDKSHLLHYTSIFEGSILLQNSNNSNGLLYLGGFDEDKGALETIELSNKYNIPLFIFGHINNKVQSMIVHNNNIKYYGYMNSEQILDQLHTIVKEYFLFGVSLIKPIHNSYKIQIANKEIDYISLGIPIIGNDREPTKSIIDSGCGLYFQLFTNTLKVYEKDSMYHRTIDYAKDKFSFKDYEEKLLKILNDI